MVERALPDSSAFIAYVDTTYPYCDDEFSEYSSRLRRRIESETGFRLSEVDIHPGASGPGWLAEIPIHDLAIAGSALAIFFSGKSISQNLSAWLELAKRVRRALHRPAYLSRSAAASLAIDEILALRRTDHADRVVLMDYRIADSRFENWEDARPYHQGTPIEPMSVLIHVFEITVDGDRYMAVVQGNEVGVRPAKHQDC